MATDQMEQTHGTARLPQEGVAWRSIRIRRPLDEVKAAWNEAEIPGNAEFSSAPADRGTIIDVTIDDDEANDETKHRLSPYEGSSIAEELETALREFKARLEAGEVPTITGQPDGRHD